MQQKDKENLAKLARRVKELRLKKSKSLNHFVFSQGGVTSSTWSRIENGKFDVKFNTLIKVASMLDVSLSELLRDIDFDYSYVE